MQLPLDDVDQFFRLYRSLMFYVPDDGTRVPIEQPTAIVTRPLSEKD